MKSECSNTNALLVLLAGLLGKLNKQLSTNNANAKARDWLRGLHHIVMANIVVVTPSKCSIHCDMGLLSGVHWSAMCSMHGVPLVRFGCFTGVGFGDASVKKNDGYHRGGHCCGTEVWCDSTLM